MDGKIVKIDIKDKEEFKKMLLGEFGFLLTDEESKKINELLAKTLNIALARNANIDEKKVNNLNQKIEEVIDNLLFKYIAHRICTVYLEMHKAGAYSLENQDGLMNISKENKSNEKPTENN